MSIQRWTCEVVGKGGWTAVPDMRGEFVKHDAHIAEMQRVKDALREFTQHFNNLRTKKQQQAHANALAILAR